MSTVTTAQQGVGVGFVWGQVASQLQCLVETAFTQTCWREGHGHHPCGGVQRGFDPRGVAHEVGQGAAEAGVSLKLEAGNAARPRKGVADSGHAGV